MIIVVKIKGALLLGLCKYFRTLIFSWIFVDNFHNISPQKILNLKIAKYNFRQL